MADTVISDAVVFPQDEGMNDNLSDGNETWDSAGYLEALAEFEGEEGYAKNGLTFSGHDGANDQVDVDAGRAYVKLSAPDVQSTLGGGSPPSYDTTLSDGVPLLVELPTTVTDLDVVDSQLNPIWLAYATDGNVTGVSTGDVYLRHENGGSVTSPPHPSIKLGEANPDDASADTRASDDAVLTPRSVGSDQIYDSTGRYLGSFDGTDDLTVISDAITDRVSGAGLIIPDPGFDLDGDVTVVLPDEDEFSLRTLGVPTIVPQTGFGDSPVIEKQADTGGTSQHMEIGSFHIENNNDELSTTPALLLDDIGFSDIYRWTVFGAPPLAFKASNSFPARNKVWGWRMNTDKGPGIEMRANNNTADQNWIIAPMFSDLNNKTETAYIDRGKHNSWLFSGVEHAAVCHLQDGSRNYHIVEGNWDRPADHTVKEKGDAVGFIERLWGNNYDALRLIGNNTRVSHRNSPAHGAHATMGATDIFGDLRGVTPAHTLAALGLRDNSTNGSVTIGNSFFIHPQIEWSTGGANQGDTAVLDLGDRAMKVLAYPKAAYDFSPVSTGGASDDDDDVLVRHGFFNGSSDFAELIYDPTDHLSTSVVNTANWNFRVTAGGTIQDTVDMGVAPSFPQDHAINREGLDATNQWFAAVGRSNTAVIDPSTELSGEGTYRLYVETRVSGGGDKAWRMRGDRGMHLYRT